MNIKLLFDDHVFTRAFVERRRQEQLSETLTLRWYHDKR